MTFRTSHSIVNCLQKIKQREEFMALLGQAALQSPQRILSIQLGFLQTGMSNLHVFWHEPHLEHFSFLENHQDLIKNIHGYFSDTKELSTPGRP
ncbi:MAG: hypothetical protein K6G00_00045 [Treponema sp.]|nr:hypothetical protein [Treponema sp.]